MDSIDKEFFNESNNNVEKVELKKEQRFYEKISFWIFLSIWIITVAVAVITWCFMPDRELVSALSLFGSISSIILAFLAIIYSYIQTNKQGDAERYMQYTLKRIEIQLDSLVKLNDKMRDYGEVVRKHLEELKVTGIEMRAANESFQDGINRVKEQLAALDVSGNLKESTKAQELVEIKNNLEKLVEDTAANYNNIKEYKIFSNYSNHNDYKEVYNNFCKNKNFIEYLLNNSDVVCKNYNKEIESSDEN